MKSKIFRFFLCLLLSAWAPSRAAEPIRALIVTGQNNHNWPVSHRVLKSILENSGRFAVSVAVSPGPGEDMSGFAPDFGACDVVVLDYNGDRWPSSTDSAFVRYLRGGGGLVVYHAANNAFAGWEEFNRITALGGWEGRDERWGPYLYYENGRWVRDRSAGPGGSHGEQREYVMHGHAMSHPVTRGLPAEWLHATDELYDRMRGPAEVEDVLYSAYADPSRGGSGCEEPLVFTVRYHKARIFHLMLGHAGDSPEHSPSMQCVGFQTLLLRGVEWAATGRATESARRFSCARRESPGRNLRCPVKWNGAEAPRRKNKKRRSRRFGSSAFRVGAVRIHPGRIRFPPSVSPVSPEGRGGKRSAVPSRFRRAVFLPDA